MSKKKSWLLIAAAVAALMVLFARPGQTAPEEPEEIDYGDYMALTDDYIYYSTAGNPELACVDLLGEVYGHVPNGGGRADRRRSLINCEAAPFPRNAMVSDGRTTFFITYVDGFSAHALFSRPADGSEKPTQLTLDLHLAPRALAIDADYVYYATLEGMGSQILRRHKETGVVDVVAAVGDMLGDSINGLTVGNTYVYWTEGAQGGPGRVRRAFKAGGAPAVVADGLDLPWDIVIDVDHVYWTELEGERVARHSKTGFGATESLYQSNQPVYSLFVHSDMVYFGTGKVGTQNGAVYRVKTNGADPILMSYGFPPPQDIAWVDNWIYWVDSHLRRLRPDAVSTPVDYGIERIEVTQAVQDGLNSVPMVASKPTFVRVYARELISSANEGVRARLYGYSDGAPLPGSPLQPVANNILDLRPFLPTRADVTDTYLFSLPDEWIQAGEIDLQAEVNPNDQVFESNYDNNLYPAAPKAFAFSERRVCLVTYPVAAKTEVGDTVIFDNDPAVYDPRMNRARTLLPVYLQVVKQSTVIWLEETDEGNVPHDIPNDPGESSLLAAINDTGVLSDAPTGCIPEATRYAGIVDEQAAYTAGVGGRASGDHWWGRWWDANSTYDYILPAGGFLFAHETGHTLGRPHVDCGGAGNPGYYPYPPCQNDYTDSQNSAWGYDPITGAAPNPATNPDLMAYGAPRWVSDFTWKCIYDYVGDAWGLPGTGVTGCDGPPASTSSVERARIAAANQGGPIVTGTAMMTPGGLQVMNPFAYNDVEHLTAGQQELLYEMPNEGSWKVILLDANGGEMASKYIAGGDEIHDSEGKTAAYAPFALQAPAEPARLEIRDAESNELLYEHAPSGKGMDLIELQSVFGNDDGDIEANFTAEDADGDQINIITQFIDPDGRKQLVARTQGSRSAKYSCDPCIWPGRTLHGGTGAVRIFASDGLHTTMVQAKVQLPTKPPEVSVLAEQHGPADENGFATFGLWATVWDAEDGPDVDSMHWFISGDVRARQRISSGESLLFISRENTLAEDFESSIVQVELQVTDSDGLTTTTTVEVDLQPIKVPPPPPATKDEVIYMPVVIRGS